MFTFLSSLSSPGLFPRKMPLYIFVRRELNYFDLRSINQSNQSFAENLLLLRQLDAG